MAQHPLYNWKQYLTDDDYNYLIQYVENVKNNIPNDKMLILSGPGSTGKSTLMDNISLYLGRDLCRFDFHTPGGELIYDETIKPLLFFEGIDEIFHSKKKNRAIINFIKYKQSFIVSTICIERVNSKLLEYSKIIKMNHIFERNAICRIISEIKSPK